MFHAANLIVLFITNEYYLPEKSLRTFLCFGRTSGLTISLATTVDAILAYTMLGLSRSYLRFDQTLLYWVHVL